MIARDFDAITAADVLALVANRVAERRTLEFKRDLPALHEGARKEFLADVSSFANAQGGDIVYGIDAPQGVAASVTGVAVDDPDKELLRWEDILLAGLEPRIPGLKLRWIEQDHGPKVLVIRVPASTIAPHRVIFGRSNRFFGRKGNGKYELDTHELRDAFTATEELPRRIRALHLEAVDRARRGEVPFLLGDDPTAVASLIPSAIFRERGHFDVTPETAMAAHKPSGAMEFIRMIEGVLVHTVPRDVGGVRSYSLTHRDGRIDLVWTIGRAVNEGMHDEMKVVWPKRFEDGVIDAAVSGASKLGAFGLEGPWTVAATAFGLRGFQLRLGESHCSEPAWRDEAQLPPIFVERMTREALLPVMRAFWLAFGEERPREPFGETC